MASLGAATERSPPPVLSAGGFGQLPGPRRCTFAAQAVTTGRKSSYSRGKTGQRGRLPISVSLGSLPKAVW